MTAEEWTLDELIGRVAAQLDDTAYAGAPNGRVREVPDARAVRWYTTIGLVDRPAMRGRTAWYGPRHLAQLVAIKRLQSEGYKIAEIQAELAEAPDDVLQDIAALDRPKGMPRRFWMQRPAEYVPEEAAPAPIEIVPGTGPVDAGSAPPGHGRPVPGSTGSMPGEFTPAGQVPARSAPSGRRRSEPAVTGHRWPESRPAAMGLLSGVPLGGGAVLLLNTTPNEDDLEAIRHAARELMDVLATRELVTPDETMTRRGNAT
ncbi:MerR family transcriptional regulator [Dactylosporangium sp. CS-047395]|uniref:helix-turn-helix domain-containing protein n=1 Tax=Dactylosporangium sp. CS-047395 TaxID=3239936 RepID=UPI003D8A0F4E